MGRRKVNTACTDVVAEAEWSHRDRSSPLPGIQSWNLRWGASSCKNNDIIMAMQESESSFGLSRHTSQIVCRRQTYADDDDDDDDTETSPVCFRFQPCACVWPGACVHLAVVSSAIKIFSASRKTFSDCIQSLRRRVVCLPSPCPARAHAFETLQLRGVSVLIHA